MLFKRDIFKIKEPEKKESIDRLRESSVPNYDFFLMLFMAVVIISLGLLISNITIIIGGILVVPLLCPILALSMGIVTADFKLIKRSIFFILGIILLTLLVSFIISLLIFHRTLNTEILSRVSPNLIYFFIALVSGIAGSYAFAKPNLSGSLPNVAITVVILPPLVVSGIGIYFLNWRIVIGSLGLFFVNIIAVIFASIIIFSLLGFYEKKKYIPEKIIREEKEIEKEKLVHSNDEIKKATENNDKIPLLPLEKGDKVKNILDKENKAGPEPPKTCPCEGRDETY